MSKQNYIKQDRRQSVRVSGKNLFYFRPVSPEDFAAIQKDFVEGIPPYNQEGLSDMQMFVGAQSALARIREKDEDLADFLSHMDTKINLILKKTTAGKTIFDRLSLHDLSLSGRGLSFVCDHAIDPETLLEFHIALLPTYNYVYCFGKALSSKPVTEGEEEGFKVAAEFVLIMEEDQEKLIQHNFKQQSLALRNRRLNKEG